MTDSSQRDRARLARVWSIIEAQKSFPCMIAVTSATEDDSRESIARSLAKLAQNAGRQAGYLELDSGGQSARTVSETYSELVYPQDCLPRHGSACDAFDAAAACWRERFDVVVVDVALLSLGVLGAHVARVADCVVIGVCADRRVTAEDRELKALLVQLQVSAIGVVETGKRRPNARAAGVLVPQVSWRSRLRSVRSLFFPAREP